MLLGIEANIATWIVPWVRRVVEADMQMTAFRMLRLESQCWKSCMGTHGEHVKLDVTDVVRVGP